LTTFQKYGYTQSIDTHTSVVENKELMMTRTQGILNTTKSSQNVKQARTELGGG
jgi:hypothetical protein